LVFTWLRDGSGWVHGRSTACTRVEKVPARRPELRECLRRARLFRRPQARTPTASPLVRTPACDRLAPVARAPARGSNDRGPGDRVSHLRAGAAAGAY